MISWFQAFAFTCNLHRYVTEERMTRLTAKQLVGVVGDLLAMAVGLARHTFLVCSPNTT